MHPRVLSMPFVKLSSQSLTSVPVSSSSVPSYGFRPIYRRITPAGTMLGNDDQAVMVTWLIWHLLGFYPGPLSSSIHAIFLKGSPHSNPSSPYHVPHTLQKKGPWQDGALHNITN